MDSIAGNFSLVGKIRSLPSDFIVEEVWDSRICKADYTWLNRLRDQVMVRTSRKRTYLHFTLVKSNWETMRALYYISRKTHVSQRKFGISGMKDKRAVTSQRVSLLGGNARTLMKLRISGIRLKDYDYSEQIINIGNATGNQFTITIRDIPKTKNEIKEILNQFKEVAAKGVPNYFGPQRLDDNVEAGAALKEGDLKLAVEIILRKTSNLSMGEIPKALWYEKRILKHLKKHPDDFQGAINKIPRRVLRLYINAYQSHIFNEELRQSLLNNSIPLAITVPGFEVPSLPELNAYPMSRETLLKAKGFQVLKAVDGMAVVRFTLKKGEYASILLSFLQN